VCVFELDVFGYTPTGNHTGQPPANFALRERKTQLQKKLYTPVGLVEGGLMDGHIRIALQLVVALGILNVWILRAGRKTPYRGGGANSLRGEFATYGLPSWSMYLVGALKIGLALTLLAAIWIPGLAQPAAIALGVLMIGAFTMHLKVKDPIQKALPSIAMLVMCAAIALL
jgi:hypothetical protein